MSQCIKSNIKHQNFRWNCFFFSYPLGACQQISNRISCHFNQCAVWSFSGEQLFSVCSRWDRDYAAIYHSRINSTVITRLDRLRICAYLQGLSPFGSLKQHFNGDCPWLPNVPCLHICRNHVTLSIKVIISVGHNFCHIREKILDVHKMKFINQPWIDFCYFPPSATHTASPRGSLGFSSRLLQKSVCWTRTASSLL